MAEPTQASDADLKYALVQQASTRRDHAHLEPELLVAYHSRRLDLGEERRVKKHLLWCRECTALLLGLEDLTRSVTKELADESPELQSAHRGTQAQPSAEGRNGRRRPFGRPWFYALAASLLLATAVLAFQVFHLRQEVEHLSEPRIDVAVQDLYLADSHRDLKEDSGEDGPVLLGETEWVTLILNAPTSDSRAITHGDYLLTIEDSDGIEIWRRHGLSKSEWDTFSVVIKRSFLAPGSYRLRVFGLEEGRWILMGEFPLRTSPP